MQRKNVTSSNLASIGYDNSSEILEIEFKDRSVYNYYKVPERLYSGLMNLSSHGTYFHANIRGKYGDTKIS
jgi:hypothetical protein